MKKINRQGYHMASYIVLALVMVFMSVIPAMAEGSNSSIIDLTEIKNEKFNPMTHQFKYWVVTEDKLSDEALKLEKKTLDELSETDLDKKYPLFFISEKPGEDKKISLENLDQVTYYFRDITDDNNEVKVDSFFIRLPLSEGEENIVKPSLKVEKPEAPVKEVAAGKMVVKLTSENGKALKGGQFKLFQKKDSVSVPVPIKDGKYSLDGSIEYTFTTNDNGEISADKLPPGNYLFRQVKAPEGYEIIKADHDFTITDNQSNRIEVVNKFQLKLGDHNFLKYDKANNNLLSGAIFKVTTYDEVAKKYNAISRDGKDYTVTSGDKGQFSVENLPYGTYYLVEIQSPKGYKLSSTPVKFTIDGNSHKLRTDIANEKLVVSGGSSSGGSSGGSKSTGGKIPKTGDVVLPILGLSGLALVIGGRKLVKREDE